MFTADVARVFLEKLGVAEPYNGIITAPEDIEIAVRKNEVDGIDRQFMFVLNYSGVEQMIMLHKKLRNVYTGEVETGEQTLSGYGTRVYEVVEKEIVYA